MSTAAMPVSAEAYIPAYAGVDMSGHPIGTGETLASVIKYVIHTIEEYRQLPASMRVKLLSDEFNDLALKWKAETSFHSVRHKIVLNESFLRIIGMGPKALPLILKDLDKNGGLWFEALKAISGANPADAVEAGNIPEMKAAWLSWGREQGYIFQE